MLADETVVETVGQVHTTSLQLPGFDRSKRTRVTPTYETVVETVGQVHVTPTQLQSHNTMSFHILPDLVCDVILGEEFLEQMDAFNTYEIIDSDNPWDLYSLKPFINLGPVQSLLGTMASNIKKTKRSSKQTRRTRRRTVASSQSFASQHGNTAEAEHSALLEEEMYKRHQTDRLIAKTKDKDHAAIAAREEVARRRTFESKHIGCVHCINRTGGPIFDAKAMTGGGSGISRASIASSCGTAKDLVC